MTLITLTNDRHHGSDDECDKRHDVEGEREQTTPEKYNDKGYNDDDDDEGE